MKLFDFMKKNKVEEEPKSKAEIKATENSSNDDKTQVEAQPNSHELYFDDNDIGYC